MGINSLPGSAGRLSGVDWSSNDFGGSISSAAAEFKRAIAGQQFEFLKATQGTGYTNPYFASQWKILGDKVKSGAMALRVAYHYLDAGSASSGVAQAKHFLAQAGVHGKLPAGTRLALDFEGGALGTPSVLKGAANYIHQVTGQWPIVYTSSGNMAEAIAQVPNAPRWEANYGAHYRGINDRGGAVLPSSKDTFYQYSDGSGYGLHRDLNVFNGSVSDLKKFASGQNVHGTGGVPTGGGSSDPVLRQGASGASVTRLQQLLAKKGFNPGGIDGQFGPHTLAAVEAFQRSRHLTVDGIVGPQTWGALEKA